MSVAVNKWSYYCPKYPDIYKWLEDNTNFILMIIQVCCEFPGSCYKWLLSTLLDPILFFTGVVNNTGVFYLCIQGLP